MSKGQDNIRISDRRFQSKMTSMNPIIIKGRQMKKSSNKKTCVLTIGEGWPKNIV